MDHQLTLKKLMLKVRSLLRSPEQRSTTNAVQALLTDSPAKERCRNAWSGCANRDYVIAWIALAISGEIFFQQNGWLHRKNQQCDSSFVMKKSEAASIASLMETKKSTGKLNVEAKATKAVPGKNVAGIMKGTIHRLKMSGLSFRRIMITWGSKKMQAPIPFTMERVTMLSVPWHFCRRRNSLARIRRNDPSYFWPYRRRKRPPGKRMVLKSSVDPT